MMGNTSDVLTGTLGFHGWRKRGGIEKWMQRQK